MKLKYSFFFLCFFTMSAVIFSQEKKIADLQILGQKKTKNSLLKKLITAKKGTLLDSVVLEKDAIVLKRLSGVRHAYYQVFLNDNNTYNVQYHIEENFTVVPEVNIWTTTDNQFSYRIGLYDYNFLGKNISFGGFYQNNGFHSYAINFKAPNLF